MKLGIIDHWKCDEPSGYRTLVWVPDEWTREYFVKAVYRASDAYITFLKAFKNEPAPNDYLLYHGPFYSKYPAKTVAEVDAEWEAKKIVWEVWDKQRQQAKDSFATYLKKEGMLYLHEYEPECQMKLEWGHNHGLGIKFSETEIEKKDLTGPLGRRLTLDEV